MAKSTNGICYLTGAGPGDLGLVTLKARQLISEAEVIVYDYLCNPEMLAWAPKEVEIIYAGKKAGDHTLTQDEINALLVEKTKAGKRVVRLKGGDPFLFGRGGEEAEALAKEGLRFEIVPGVTSAIAAPAYAGIPVTHRGHNAQLTIFTGHEDPTKPEQSINYAELAKQRGTKVMLMGVERLEQITAKLLEHGASPDLPVALVRWGTTTQQESVSGTLSTIAQIVKEREFKAPAVAVFGDVVSLRNSLNWFETKPLFGKRIVVTRTRKQAGKLSERLKTLGANVLELPTIKIEEPTRQQLLEFGELVRDTHIYDWLVFTSPNGVEAYFDMFYRIYNDAREIGGVRIAALGPATAAKVREYRLTVDLMAETAVAESLVKAFVQDGTVENLKILIAHAEKARDVLFKELTKLGAIVDEAIAYRTVPEHDSEACASFAKDGADLITFASSSAVENFMALNLPLPANLKTASIGPVTSKTMRQLGLKVDIEAKQHDIAGLVEAIEAYYA